ncbi:MAG: sodium:proton antiporter [Alphaproteobacteria bacterium]|nr:sodium:proton antiporter [Alphaproteobacteria bacterium]
MSDPAASMFHDPNLTVALALTAGIAAQTVATHLRVPGIVLLLAVGVLLGPDVLGVVHPELLGGGLTALVGFAVAVILFEGGMNLSVPRLRRAEAAIRRLVTVGALATAVLSTIAARSIMAWPWATSILFGTLVIVTGPTVVTPLLKRLKVQKEVATILEAEGVLIDPIGAIIAIVALDLVQHPSAGNVLLSIPGVIWRLGFGGVLGVAGGWALSRVLTVRDLVPEGLTNVFTLSSVFALYQIAEAMQHESGIAAVTMAGIAVRYLGTPVERELLEFKEQLTVMLIGMLFVLLAADVRVADVEALGWPGFVTVLALMFVVRPINVFVSTVGTSLDWKQKVYLMWIAPRGIVAAAVASLFAIELQAAGVPGGVELRALVFLVISVTVVFAGFTGGLGAWLLGLRRPRDAGWVVLGAHALGRTLGKALAENGEEVLLIDVNPDNCHKAQEAGFRVIHGNAMKETVLGMAELDTRAGAIGLTRNEEVNFLFVQKARQLGRLQRLYVSLSNEATGVTPEMVHGAHAHILFGGEHDVERWSSWLDQGLARVVHAIFDGTDDAEPRRAAETRCGDKALPLVMKRNGAWSPVGDQVTFRKKDRVTLVIDDRFEDDVVEQLRQRGFRLTDDLSADDATGEARRETDKEAR